MRKHEMVYVFYEKLPYYDLSSHKHKFLKEDEREMKEINTLYNGKMKRPIGKTREPTYNPPLPTSIIKGVDNTYNTEGRKKPITREPPNKYDPPLPTTIVKEEIKYDVDSDSKLYGDVKRNDFKDRKNSESRYDPPLPTTMLEIKSTKGKHSTEKPVALMEWILKYYSKEGDTILDPTMGSGSTGVACKNMKRNFIGIEMDDEIYDVAYKRLNE